MKVACLLMGQMSGDEPISRNKIFPDPFSSLISKIAYAKREAPSQTEGRSCVSTVLIIEWRQLKWDGTASEAAEKIEVHPVRTSRGYLALIS